MRLGVILTILVCSIGTSLTAQLKISDMTSVPFGSLFSNSEVVTAKFKNEPIIMVGTFLNAYQIVYKDTDFDYYGPATYTYQYVKDTMAQLMIDYEFPISESWKGERVLKHLASDFKNTSDLQYRPERSQLNIERIIAQVKKANEDKARRDFLDDNSDSLHLGHLVFWFKDKVKHKYEYVYITVSFSHKRGWGTYAWGGRYEIDEWSVRIRSYVSNSLFVDLLTLEENEKGLEYRENRKQESKINLEFKNGVYTVPVNICQVITMNFVLDLGASDVSLSPDLFLVLLKSGAIKDDDFIGSQEYRIADGTTVKSSVFNLKSLTIGNKTIENVQASISKSVDAPLLLGQSALRKLGKYSIDNDRKLLIIEQ
jgi:aspartyl protease family protein